MDTSDTTNPVSTAAAPQPHHGGLHWTGNLHLHFPGFKRDHHVEIINVNKVHDEQMTRGDKIADGVAAMVGSWRFITVQSTILLIWIILNVIAWRLRWDPYPFILLNLALSFQAAYSAPFVMMSQNRQAAKDRLTAENDYRTDMQGEEEIRHILAHLEHQDTLIIKIIERLEAQHEEMLQRLGEIDPALVRKVIALTTSPAAEAPAAATNAAPPAPAEE